MACVLGINEEFAAATVPQDAKNNYRCANNVWEYKSILQITVTSRHWVSSQERGHRPGKS